MTGGGSSPDVHDAHPKAIHGRVSETRPSRTKVAPLPDIFARLTAWRISPRHTNIAPFPPAGVNCLNTFHTIEREVLMAKSFVWPIAIVLSALILGIGTTEAPPKEPQRVLKKLAPN